VTGRGRGGRTRPRAGAGRPGESHTGPSRAPAGGGRTETPRPPAGNGPPGSEPAPAGGGRTETPEPLAGNGHAGTGPAPAANGQAGTGPAPGGNGHPEPGGSTAWDGAGVVEVAAVDDHPIVLAGIATWVAADSSGLAVIGTATTVGALLAGPGRHARVVLLDLDLGDGSSVDQNVGAIRAAGAAVLVLAASDKPVSVRAAMRAGALGYVLKSEPTEIVRAAIKAVAAGQDWISPRLAYILATDNAPDRPALSGQETRALSLYATGMPMKLVARRMGLSEETAKQYVGRVREKYARAGRAAPTKLELYYRAVEDGHLPPLP
jgi:two-component system, NarL family, nitrate/nitrite response regulator NarL